MKAPQILVMGVSGSGKSTIGFSLAKQLGVKYLEADDYHPAENIEKMSKGLPLNDEDRWPWLDNLASAALQMKEEGYVVSCSGLKESYRKRLIDSLGEELQIVWLKGDFDLIRSRMQSRGNHFMPESLLKSQFDDLEEPQNAITFDIKEDPKDIVSAILELLDTNAMKAEIGVLGLGVMGKSLARNFASTGVKTAVFNVPFPGEENVVTEFVDHFPEAGFLGASDLEEFVSNLERPRAILLMIKAGEPVDEMIEKLIPLLEKGDIIIDGGNSYYEDSTRRYKYLKSKGIEFVGMGVSGGEKGALVGPAMMPAGSDHSRDRLLDTFRRIAANADGEPCVDWIGKDGAGHFVKMIHNGIEYADMQLLTEVYAICKNALGYSNTQTAELMESWKSTIHDSYLLDITIDILRYQEDGAELLEEILDVAGHKGTGLWTSKVGLDLGVPIPTIASAMNERILSSKKALRTNIGRTRSNGTIEINGDILRDGFLFARLIALAEGFYLIKTASDAYNWDVNLTGLCQVWRGGCIIRSDMLLEVKKGLTEKREEGHLLESPSFGEMISELETAAYTLLSKVCLSDVATPALSASVSYYKSLKTGYLPINLIQAQRDYFGAHTYKKLSDRSNSFHTHWGDH